MELPPNCVLFTWTVNGDPTGHEELVCMVTDPLLVNDPMGNVVSPCTSVKFTLDPLTAGDHVTPNVPHVVTEVVDMLTTRGLIVVAFWIDPSSTERDSGEYGDSDVFRFERWTIGAQFAPRHRMTKHKRDIKLLEMGFPIRTRLKLPG